MEPETPVKQSFSGTEGNFECSLHVRSSKFCPLMYLLKDWNTECGDFGDSHGNWGANYRSPYPLWILEICVLLQSKPPCQVVTS